MRKFILLLFVAIVPITTFAQEGSGLGFNWGANISNLVFSEDNTISIDNGVKCGFSTELYYDVALSKNFYIQPGLAFSMRGMKCSSDDTKASLGYLQIPTLLSYRIFLNDKHALGFNVGPTFGYALYGNVKIADNKYKIFGDDFKDIGINCNRFEVGLNAGVSYYIIGHVISLSWERALTNLYEESNFNVKNTTIALTFGYRY